MFLCLWFLSPLQLPQYLPKLNPTTFIFTFYFQNNNIQNENYVVLRKNM